MHSLCPLSQQTLHPSGSNSFWAQRTMTWSMFPMTSSPSWMSSPSEMAAPPNGRRLPGQTKAPKENKPQTCQNVMSQCCVKWWCPCSPNCILKGDTRSLSELRGCRQTHTHTLTQSSEYVFFLFFFLLDYVTKVPYFPYLKAFYFLKTRQCAL